MVVDDDADIRDSLVELLEEHGYRAVGAANGVEALRILEASDPLPSLILLDLMMPVMDGRAFREEQRAHPTWSRIPVLLMSAYRDVADQARSLGVEHLAKPLGIKPLMAAMQRLCASE